MTTLETEFAGPKKARVEIIPLIDVIFFLLATFVLFTLTLQRVKVLEADFPKATGQGSVLDDKTVFIQASADGTYHWKVGRANAAEAIVAAEIGPRLATYKRGTESPRVLVRSDLTAKLNAIVYVLDEVRRAGIKDVAVETIVTASGS